MAALAEAAMQRWFTERFRQSAPATVDRFHSMVSACPGRRLHRLLRHPAGRRPARRDPPHRLPHLGTQIALRQWDQYRIHVRAALVEGGFTADDVNEIVLQQAIYCGAPAALTAITIARELLKEIEEQS